MYRKRGERWSGGWGGSSRSLSLSPTHGTRRGPAPTQPPVPGGPNVLPELLLRTWWLAQASRAFTVSSGSQHPCSTRRVLPSPSTMKTCCPTRSKENQ